MLIRLVRMTFKPENKETFLTLFETTAPKIRSFAGCRRLELWEDVAEPTVLTTYSIWDDEIALENYRASLLFQETWAKTKPLFAQKTQAFSHILRYS